MIWIFVDDIIGSVMELRRVHCIGRGKQFIIKNRLHKFNLELAELLLIRSIWTLGIKITPKFISNHNFKNPVMFSAASTIRFNLSCINNSSLFILVTIIFLLMQFQSRRITLYILPSRHTNPCLMSITPFTLSLVDRPKLITCLCSNLVIEN